MKRQVVAAAVLSGSNVPGLRLTQPPIGVLPVVRRMTAAFVETLQPGPQLYFGSAEARFQPLKQRLESGWVELLRERVGLARDRLPLLWDCDFMLREAAPAEPTGYVLCEVNVSSVSPFPPSAITPLVHAVATRLRRGS